MSSDSAQVSGWVKMAGMGAAVHGATLLLRSSDASIDTHVCIHNRNIYYCAMQFIRAPSAKTD